VYQELFLNPKKVKNIVFGIAPPYALQKCSALKIKAPSYKNIFRIFDYKIPRCASNYTAIGVLNDQIKSKKIFCTKTKLKILSNKIQLKKHETPYL
jgi:hypothetical protein